MKSKNFILFVVIVVTFMSTLADAQTATRVTGRGKAANRRTGIHNGNMVHTVFTNYGVICQPAQDKYPRGAWKYDHNGYIGDVSPLLGVLNPKTYTKYSALTGAVKDTTIDTVAHTVDITSIEQRTLRTDPYGNPWTLEAIGGFFNPSVNQDGKGVAMSHQPDTWPAQWPDQPTYTYSGSPIYSNGDTIVPTVDWNGYYGRGQARTADQESYFWMDDNSDTQMFDAFGFIPDSADVTRRGHALQVSVRGLQWGSDKVSQNALFWLYSIKNDGTTTYDEAVFGLLVGTYVGIQGNEWSDDASFFDVRESITYTWDFDHYISPSDNPNWMPNASAVGYVAYAFLESPGNGTDGIDNDHDNANMGPSQSPYFTEDDFKPRVLKTGDKYVLIDKTQISATGGGRSVHTVGLTQDTVYSMGVKFIVGPGDTLPAEGNYAFKDTAWTLNPNAIDGIDNNLNGLIDESYTTNYRQYKVSPAGVVLIDTLNATQHFDYINNIGLNDWMIDEKRDDGIDNDHDWSKLTDDTNGDGVPSPKEPNFDETDVHESDQLGLTSFQYFVPSSNIKLVDNEDLWKRMKPGYFDVPKSVVNNVATKGEDGDFIYASGYFPLMAGKSENFSLALAFGDDLPGVIKTKRSVQLIYNAGYQSPKPPDVPTLTVVPGDGRVTLYWDKVSEESIDQISREKDFEGYKIYRSTSYDLMDQHTVTDAQGSEIGYKQFKQFDLADGVTGYYPLPDAIRDLYSGYSPYLGDDSGIQHSFVDTAVTNGRTYYYVLTSYDRGDQTTPTYPQENPVSGCITKNSLGIFTYTKNAGAATPAKPSVGYVPPASGVAFTRTTGHSTKGGYFEVVDPYKLKNTSYTVSFADTLLPEYHTKDTIWQGPIATKYSVKNTSTGVTVLSNLALKSSDGTVFDGVRVSIDTTYQAVDSIKLSAKWKIHNSIDSTQTTLSFSYISSLPSANLFFHKYAKDYAVVFSDAANDSSNDLYPLFPSHAKAKNINFKIYDVTDPATPKQIKFVFQDGTVDSTISAKENLYLSNEDGTALSWCLQFTNSSTTLKSYKPKGNDTLQIRATKPINATDSFTFTVDKASYSASKASVQLDKIKVVPNPYVATNLFESEPATGLKGRGTRVITFNSLPPQCKISIYTSSGDLVKTLQHNDNVLNGTERWDLKTKEGLDVAFGVYFYVVEADGISEKKTGKIAIIK